MRGRPTGCDGRIVKRALVAVAAGVAAATSGLAVVPDAVAAGGYKTYVACSHKKTAKPAHECNLSDPKAAFFRSANHDATYKVCVRFPGKKKRLCASAQAADQGETRVVTITTAKLGTHKVWWYVGGEQVGRWTFEVVAD
jgi:hypothetical protein